MSTEDTRTLEHAKAGYSNAQEVIRFLDSKAGALIGLSSVTTGLGLVVLKWFIELNERSPLSIQTLTIKHPEYIYSAGIVTIVGILLGSIAILCCLHGLNARSPFRDRRDGRRPPVLFPMYNPDRHLRLAHESFAKITAGMSERDIAGEYEQQLKRVGAILHEKIACLRYAVKLMEYQVALFILAFLLLVLAKYVQF
jgi:hypothetical protein